MWVRHHRGQHHARSDLRAMLWMRGVLKKDCEGTEYDILLATLSGSLVKIVRICIEHHNRMMPYTHLDSVSRPGHHGLNLLHRHSRPLYALRKEVH